MKKTAFKLSKLIFSVFIGLLVLMGIFMAVLLIALFGEGTIPSFGVYEYFSSSLINSQSVYFMLSFCLVLPIALLALTLFALPMAKPLYHRRQLQKMVKAAQRKLIKEAKKVAKDAEKQSKRVKRMTKTRFPRLKHIDTVQKKKKSPQYDTSVTLEEICESFRLYAAGELGLYYSISDIRRFIAGMGISKLLILRGISGTGKTSLAYAAGEFFGNSSTIVPIQPMWKERSDLIGYFNEFTKKFSESSLLEKLYEAGGNDDLYITVLDEMNISRIEYYFAEFLSLLEIPDVSKRYLDVVADFWDSDPVRLNKGKLLLPENMWFVGTANNDDSTFSISDKVYDRAAIIDLNHKCEPFSAQGAAGKRISYQQLNVLFEEAQKSYKLSGKNRDNLAKLDAYMSDVFRVSFGNRIMKQIQNYIPIMCACGGDQLDALDDLLCRKILRKLEQLSPAYVKSEAGNLQVLLDELFGNDRMPQCREYIDKLQKGF